MSRERFEEQYSEYVLGTLEERRAEELARHLEECAECREEIARLADALHSLPLALSEESPRASLRAEILEAAAGEASPGSAPSRRPSHSPWLLGWAIAASVLAVAGLLGSWSYYVRYQEQLLEQAGLQSEVEHLTRINQTLESRIREITSPRQRHLTLAGLEGYEQIEGAAFIDPAGNRADLFLQNLPELPADRRYQLWFIEPGLPPHPSEVFGRGDGLTEVGAEVPIAAEQVASLAISIEPVGGSTSPTGPIVALGSL